MEESHQRLDLDLWLDQELVRRQNRLKAAFLTVLQKVGNSISNESLIQTHSSSKGKKISNGNDLLGFPYQVLDLIRDFTPFSGCNIRMLNWFGNGFYLMLIHGSKLKLAAEELCGLGYEFSLTETPWDYPELILDKNYSSDLVKLSTYNKGSILWFKSLELSNDLEKSAQIILKETEYLIEILKLSSQKRNELI
jgi:hypothetical protein